MDILPIDKLRDEDAPLVGGDLVNLSRLSQQDFPVASGIVVCPPEIELNTVLKYFNLHEREIFEQSLTLVHKEILKIPVPNELKKVLSRRKVKAEEIWVQLLDLWLNEVRARVWHEGFKEGVTLGLSAQPVFFTGKIAISGQAFYDPLVRHVKVELKKGELTPAQEERVSELVEKANKKLFLPQTYYWVIEEKSSKIQLIKLVPFTQSPHEEPHHHPPTHPHPAPATPKSAVKVFLDLSEGYVTNPDVDGVLICGEKSGDFEAQVFKLVEAAHSYLDRPVIFKLSDQIDHIGGVRGSLKLIHQDDLLRSEVEAVLFARNHKKLLNVAIAVPFVRSVNEFLEMKRSLATRGISRKGSLKLWLEMAVPENLLNVEDYILAGLDGVILNLDELSSWLGGFDSRQPESTFYQKQVKALLKLLEGVMRQFHLANIPVLAMGSLALHDDVLELLVAKGVKGVIVNLANSHSLHEHLRFVEQRHIRNKTT